MDLSLGDVITGKGIQYGRVCGVESISNSTFYKVEDLTQKAIHYIPEVDTCSFRKLSSKEKISEKMKMFKKNSLIDVNEIDGSRYKYFKAKLDNHEFEKSLEVLHDMELLNMDKNLNSSEKKLYSTLKEKMGLEISFVLDKAIEEVYLMFEFPKLAA